MWWKSKFMLLSFSLALLFLTLFSTGQGVKAEEASSEGFIIEADRVVGSGMTATIIAQETSGNSSKPMLRIQYKSAVIYGMKLTKQMGPVSVALKANGPVTVKGMTVDTTAISFKGACLKASETVPELGMEDVVMVAHFMESKNSVIEQLVLQTVAGKSGPDKPGQLQILKDLSMLPLTQLKKEIEKISQGGLPLTCQNGEAEDPSDGVGIITDPVKDLIDVVVNPLDPVTKPLVPILEPLDPILTPLDPVLEPILKPLDPIVKPLEPVTKPLEPVLKPLEPVVEETVETVDQVIQTVCSKVQDGKGVITKELALELIDEAILKKVPLNQVCPADGSLLASLQNLEESLIKALGLDKLIGILIPNDPIEKLKKIREQVVKQKDGTIIYSP